MIKTLLAMAAAAVLCAACAQGGSGAAGSGSINMYGTIDEGVSVRR